MIHARHAGDDHAHLHVEMPPKHSVAYAVQIIKGKSSAWLRKKTKKLPPGSLWGRGHFVSTVGVSEIAVWKHVENQRSHHAEAKQMSLIGKVLKS